LAKAATLKRLNQHFTGQTQNQKKIQALVFRVTYEETGSELIALLKVKR
jgi:DNA polymerase-3 subunit epsilon